MSLVHTKKNPLLLWVLSTVLMSLFVVCAPGGGLAETGSGAMIGGVIGSGLEKQEQDLKDMGYETSRNGNRVTAYFPNDTLFPTGSAELMPRARAELSRVADILNNDTSVSVIIGGHTDSDGTREYNQVLSELRANAVRTVLISYGIDPRRATAYGYGEDRPLVPNVTAYNKQRNRRIEITLLSPAR